MRHRTLLPLAIILALVTGAAVEASASVFSAPTPITLSATGNEAVVRRFYAAVNDVVRMGDPALLAAVVAADVTLPPTMPGESGRIGLSHRLLALHAAQPGLRLVVRGLVADRDVAVAWIALEGQADGALLALPPADPMAGLLDGFRIAGGWIVEAWGTTASLGVPQPLLDARLDGPAVAAAFVGLSRLTVDPGAAVPEVVVPGPSVVAVETGRLTVRLDGTGRLDRSSASDATGIDAPTVPGQAVSLSEEDRLTVPTATPYLLRNDGGTPATALLAVLLPPAPTMPTAADNPWMGGEVPASLVIFGPAGNGQDRAAPNWPAGVAVQRLVREIVPLPQRGPVALRVARLEIAAGEGVRGYRPPVPAVVAVASGVALVGTDAPLVLRSGQETEFPAGTPVDLDSADAEPAVLLILTVALAGGEPGSQASGSPPEGP
jgi:hypothetical protein